MAYRITLCLLAVLLGACASTQRRAMNDGERTITTAPVRALVNDQGEVDVRFEKDVHCERIKRVGTHLVQRFCYSGQNARKAAREALHRYTRSNNAASCNGCGTGRAQRAGNDGGGAEI